MEDKSRPYNIWVKKKIIIENALYSTYRYISSINKKGHQIKIYNWEYSLQWETFTCAPALWSCCIPSKYQDRLYSSMEYSECGLMRPTSSFRATPIINRTVLSGSLTKRNTKWRNNVLDCSSNLVCGNFFIITCSISSTASLPLGCL